MSVSLSVRLSPFVYPRGTSIFHTQGGTNIFHTQGGGDGDKHFYIQWETNMFQFKGGKNIFMPKGGGGQTFLE